jgi:RNAse (barnase) inhibitor barstar
MTVFRDDPSEWQRLDWRLLQNGPAALYFDPRVLDEDVKWLEAHGYGVDLFDCQTWQTEDEAHASLARKLGFPEYYGANLNALNDCLSDLEIVGEGRALVLHRFDVAASAMPRFAWHLMDILASQARVKLLTGHRLLALLQSSDPRLELAPVGRTAVMWNPREWLDMNRGI